MKEVARRMAAPTKKDLRGLKGLGRYRRVVLRFLLQSEVVWGCNLDCIYSPMDSNWADCRETRRSNSGGALVHGEHTLAMERDPSDSGALLRRGRVLWASEGGRCWTRAPISAE